MKSRMAKLAYYPLEASIAAEHADDLSPSIQLSIFAAATAGILVSTYSLTKKARPGMGTSDLCAVLWFVLCGFIHVIFEGYYVYNFKTVVNLDNFLAQLWREYAYSDSRYLTSNSVVFCIESTTAILWGPLSFLLAFLILARHPLRHSLQMIISMGQLYGVIIYMGTGIFDSRIYDVLVWRPEPYYFWVYLICMNSFWVLIPAGLIYQSSIASTKAFMAAERLGNMTHANGTIKKNR